MDMSDTTLMTKRLILRPYRAWDGDAVWPVLGRAEVSGMTMRIPHPCPREYVDDWFDFLNDARENGIACEFGLFSREDGRYIGNCGLSDILNRHRQAEVVYFIDPEQWRRGYASEALAAVRDFAFDVLKLERLSGRCLACNTASRRVMEKVGFRFEGILRHDVFRDNKFFDVCLMATLRSDAEN